MTSPDPVARYKELLDTARAAARTHGEHERARTVELIGELVDVDREIAAATTAEAEVVEEITGWWRRQVVAPLSEVGWLSPGPVPAPDPAAHPAALDEYMAEIEPATERLKAAVRKASWRRKSL